MSDCPKGPGKGCGCESGLESESECEPCQGRCGEWQKTPNFVRSLPARHVDPCTQQTLGTARIIFASVAGSLLVGGWLYHKYLHYAAAREAAKAKKTARAKPKTVKHEHLGIMGPSSTLVPKVKDLTNVETNKVIGTDIKMPKEHIKELQKKTGSGTLLSSEVKKLSAKEEDNKRIGTEAGKPKENNHELQIKTGSGTLLSSEVKKVSAKEEDNKRVGTDAGRPKENNHEFQRKTGSNTVVPSGVKKELAKVDVKKKVEPIGNTKKVKDEHVKVMGQSSTLVPKVRESADVRSNKRVETEIEKHKEVNEALKRKVSSGTGLSPGVKRDLTKVESKKNIEPIGNPKKLKHDNLKIIVPSTTPRLEVKKETELGVACGAAQEGVKKKTGEGAVITVLTQGKNGKKVKRRGWK